jgi:hypothetical protein
MKSRGAQRRWPRSSHTKEDIKKRDRIAAFCYFNEFLEAEVGSLF